MNNYAFYYMMNVYEITYVLRSAFQTQACNDSKMFLNILYLFARKA